MMIFVNTRAWLVLPLAAAVLAGCAAVPASPTASTEVAANSCRPGSFAALMSAKVDPEERPGKASLYRDCH